MIRLQWTCVVDLQSNVDGKKGDKVPLGPRTGVMRRTERNSPIHIYIQGEQRRFSGNSQV